MNRMAVFLCGAACAMLLWALTGPISAAGGRSLPVDAEVRVYIEGRLLSPENAQGEPAAAFVSDGTVYLPARSLCEALGRPVHWDSAARSVYIGGAP